MGEEEGKLKAAEELSEKTKLQEEEADKKKVEEEEAKLMAVGDDARSPEVFIQDSTKDAKFWEEKKKKIWEKDSPMWNADSPIWQILGKDDARYGHPSGSKAQTPSLRGAQVTLS